MKKFFRFLIAALSVATIAMTLTSCSAGDGTEGDDIIGSWETDMGAKCFFQFRPDGTGVTVYNVTSSLWNDIFGETVPDVDYFKWSISGDKIIWVYDDEGEAEGTIKTLTKNVLVLEDSDTGIALQFYRVADSVVNEYIEKYGKK